jgi:hypothetical protein
MIMPKFSRFSLPLALFGNFSVAVLTPFSGCGDDLFQYL